MQYFFDFENISAHISNKNINLDVVMKGLLTDTGVIEHNGQQFLIQPHTNSPPYINRRESPQCDTVAQEIESCFIKNEHEAICKARLSAQSSRDCCKALALKNIYIDCSS